ncbi:NAD(P)-dependent alcohol dehydrogenase [Mesorhizobium sp. M00.F.Ca.ET.186.01.1.1]|nr:NAD(P)-dependent alcohol dehydrogenase [bacterium M00.F.Ca.ET.205.01.1.1]TGU52055.1 NAD(P)-dependent alcohol dehydrogenase [bacterium M00.F.Ca.ET.152.01.1.1]TGV32026.1 NAD(P)-dependent alcohol dehydrogenase [Mesorhizobium sp. M00.F.Ca.ET.186.01.1.1]TGZ42595.1 NAD(P)-dependent alcohol dehydrogenase [bacterium M00.F.Ca.ET.162.01.1.1]
MKAMELQHPGGIDSLRLVERPIPEPGRQEMVIKVKATALNYRDVEIARGSYHTAFALPLVPLSDGVGEVVAVGAEVTRFKVGDRVCATFWQRWVGGSFVMAEPSYQRGGPVDGLLSEFARLDEQAAVLAPEHLSDVEAATLPCAAVTAWHALFTEGRLKPGETVLTLGTGGVSLFAVQFAAAAGARVIVTSSSDDKLTRAKGLGAHDGINYRSDPDWASAVLALTGGRGADHIIEVGGPQSFAQSLRASARGAQINVIGYLGGNEGAINPLDIFRRQVQARGIPVGSRESFEAMNRALAVNRLRPVIHKVLPWREAAGAFHHLEHGSPFGKIVLDHMQ